MIQATAAAGVALSLLAPPVLNSVAALPARPIAISILTVNGSGCPLGTTAVAASPDNAAFTVTYSDYLVQVGPDAAPTPNRQNCQLVLNVRVPHGMSYSIVKADYRGYAKLLAGASGWEQANYYFQGQAPTLRVRHRFGGPFDGNWAATDSTRLDKRVWSPCGAPRYLNVNTSLRVIAGASDPAVGTSFMSMDSTDGGASTTYHLEWKKCP